MAKKRLYDIVLFGATGFTGGLTAERPMWSWLHHCGIWTAELEWFHANRCIPDVMGINTYRGTVPHAAVAGGFEPIIATPPRPVH